MLFWMLDESGEPRQTENVREWGTWLERNPDVRRVALDTIGDAEVSTVFLAVDHAFHGGSPVLWETMVFGGPLDGEQGRYTSRAEAARGHAAMVERVRLAAN